MEPLTVVHGLGTHARRADYSGGSRTCVDARELIRQGLGRPHSAASAIEVESTSEVGRGTRATATSIGGLFTRFDTGHRMRSARDA
jgi:hypothetical protein